MMHKDVQFFLEESIKNIHEAVNLVYDVEELVQNKNYKNACMRIMIHLESTEQQINDLIKLIREQITREE